MEKYEDTGRWVLLHKYLSLNPGMRETCTIRAEKEQSKVQLYTGRRHVAFCMWFVPWRPMDRRLWTGGKGSFKRGSLLGVHEAASLMNRSMLFQELFSHPMAGIAPQIMAFRVDNRMSSESLLSIPLTRKSNTPVLGYFLLRGPHQSTWVDQIADVWFFWTSGTMS